MNAREFQATAVAILGTAVGWQSKIADRLGVTSRSVRRWIADDSIPDGVEAQLAEMIGLMDIAPWPRDEWVIGEGAPVNGFRREYVIHLAPPRFVARVVALDDNGLLEPDEIPANIIKGTVYVVDEGTVLAEIAWIDDPKPGEVAQLMEAASDFVDRSNE